MAKETSCLQRIIVYKLSVVGTALSQTKRRFKQRGVAADFAGIMGERVGKKESG